MDRALCAINQVRRKYSETEMGLQKASRKTIYDGAERRHIRALFSVPIELHYLVSGGIEKTHGVSLDLSEGGIGALVQAPLEVGETVAIEFRLSDREISTVAIVRYSSEVRSGFEFVGLTPDERCSISQVVGSA